MKSIKLRAITFALCSSMLLSAMAGVDDLPVKVVNGRTYHYYQVQPKETIYSLCQKLGITKNDIYRYNPSAADGLKVNQILLFPAEENPAGKTTVHVVAKGETVYGISKAYGITVSQLIEWNPMAKDGIRVGQRLAVSKPATAGNESLTDNGKAAATDSDEDAAEAQTATDENADVERYTIKQGQTLYRIAIEHFTSVEKLIELNPGLDSHNYQAGQIILVPKRSVSVSNTQQNVADSNVGEASAGEVVNQKDAESNTKVATYVVKKNETFYSIARKHNVTVEALENANPSVGALKEGMILTIPANEALVESVGSDSANDAKEGTVVTPGTNDVTGAETTVTTLPGEAVEPGDDSMNIALMLPFMLGNERQSRQAQLFTEFYKGFLLAVDSMRNCGTPIKVHAFDTSASLDTVKSILQRPEMKNMQLIITPDAEAQMSEIAAFGRDNNVNVLNLFVVKDQTYRNTPYLMQGNIPHHDMYEKAIKGMVGKFSEFTPVIVSRKDGVSDKAEYISMLKRHLESEGIQYKTIEFTGLLKSEDLMQLGSDGKYAVIPVSAKLSELNHIIPGLLEFKEQSTQYDPIRLFGYPEWTTFRGEPQDNMHKVNTIVYSRFYTVPDDPALKEIEDKFERWYSKPMANYVPRQGLFGFDAGMYVIKALMANGGDFDKFTPSYSGVQNGFSFTGEAGAGKVNDELYFINFRPSGLIDKISL